VQGRRVDEREGSSMNTVYMTSWIFQHIAPDTSNFSLTQMGSYRSEVVIHVGAQGREVGLPA